MQLDEALLVAVQEYSPVVVGILLKAGASANTSYTADAEEDCKRKGTVLHLAAGNIRRDCDDIVKMLVDAGADINAVDSWGYTPTILAAKNGNTRSVRFLLKRGANVDRK